MEETKKDKPNLIDQYLDVSCFNKISESIFRDMLDYESKADPIEKKLIKRIKSQVEKGKVVLSVRKGKECDH